MVYISHRSEWQNRCRAGTWRPRRRTSVFFCGLPRSTVCQTNTCSNLRTSQSRLISTSEAFYIYSVSIYLYSLYFAPEWPGRCSRSPSWPTRTRSTGGRSSTSTGSSRTSWTRFVKMEDWIWWMIALFPRYHNLLLQQRSHLPAWKQFKQHKHNCFRGFGENPAFKTHTPCKQTSIPSLPIWCRWVLEFDPR